MAPSFCIGGESAALGGVAGVGAGSWLVCEADESDGTLALYAPEVAVVTNIEFDHMEHFKREADLVDCFRRLVARTKRRVIYCADDPRAAEVGGAVPGSWSYGCSASALFRAVALRMEPFAVSFDVLRRGRRLGRLRVPVPGRHNALNALAACVAGLAAGVPFKKIGAGLAAFGPARRRFEVVAAGGGVLALSDYAHHPTEVRALIGAARNLGRRRLLAVFQPHRYTRTRALGRDFPPAFLGVDELVLTPVYAASEAPRAGGRSADLLRHFKAFGRVRARGVASLAGAWKYLRGTLRPGDTLLIVGAGDVERIAGWARDFYGGPV
ncbi:MAG: Mur ligase family protein [Kiritimatiellaeota bacterium]|nr:Mur ligase family protein [Kiritimatiellota bacterium]